MTREELIKQAAYNRYASCSSPTFVQAQCNCFIEGAKWAEKTIIIKACVWLKDNCTYIHPRTGKETCVVNLNAFKKAMEE